MLSIELIRSDPEQVRLALRKRGKDAPIDEVLENDKERRSAIAESDSLRARRNEVSKQIRSPEDVTPDLKEEMREIGTRIDEIEEQVRVADDRLDALLLALPNLPSDDAPVGDDEAANVVERTIGEMRQFDFEPLPHWDIGPALGIVDFERGAQLAGSRFFVLSGQAARLQRALISWMIDLHVNEHGYREVYLPYLVTSDTVRASGHLPHFEQEMYHDEEDDLWMLPTAEAAITSLHRDEILDAADLPISYVAHTPCWRREKFSAGRDTRGIKRAHQFEKVEMYKFVEPESSDDELHKLVADAEELAARLEVPYRVLQLCTGDMSAPAVKAYDVEMWAPGANEWLEVSSCSNCTDYQARRAKIRYRTERGSRPRLVHTLNGSGLALPRVIIAVLENYQQEDGSVVVPEVLRGYMGSDRIR